MLHRKESNSFESLKLDQRKMLDLTVSEFSIILNKIQTVAISNALKSVIPTTDPDESIYLTIKAAADLLGVTKQTIHNKKKRMLLEFYGEGRIQRTTLAAIKRYLKKFGTPLSRLKSSSV